MKEFANKHYIITFLIVLVIAGIVNHAIVAVTNEKQNEST